VFSVHDHAATKVRLQIFDTTTNALVHDSGMVEGSVVRFSTLDLGPETMRYSIRAWDDAETLVTHQITTIAQTEIASLDFDTIEVGFKFAADTIDLDGKHRRDRRQRRSRSGGHPGREHLGHQGGRHPPHGRPGRH
jgi:hypothetical protein